jgi:hypothetical protein
VLDSAFDCRIENPPRCRDLVSDERCHEKEGVDSLEHRGIDIRLFKVEWDDIAHTRQNVGDRARAARAYAKLDATAEQCATDLSTHGARRSSDEDAH